MGCKDNKRSDDQKPSNIGEDGRIQIPLEANKLREVPASVSEARAKALLPSVPSEDVTHILGKIEFPALPKSESHGKEYLPSEKVEWVVSVEFQGNPRLDPKKIEELFDTKWRERLGGFVSYGLDADSGRWTFAISADGPRAITRLKLA
jgi:cell division protein ZipA